MSSHEKRHEESSLIGSARGQENYGREDAGLKRRRILAARLHITEVKPRAETQQPHNRAVSRKAAGVLKILMEESGRAA
jgi:hypothetical protein